MTNSVIADIADISLLPTLKDRSATVSRFQGIIVDNSEEKDDENVKKYVEEHQFELCLTMIIWSPDIESNSHDKYTISNDDVLKILLHEWLWLA